MRDAVDNPFSPGSDIVPEVWAGRTAQLSDWRDVVRPRLIAGRPERGRTIVGEPGLGKSSLVRRIAELAARSGDWVTPQLRIPSGADPLKLVAGAVLALADRAGLSTSRDRRVLTAVSRVESVAVSGLALTLRRADGVEPYQSLTELLVEVGRAAIQQKNVALIHIDEVQNITHADALSQLLVALGDAITFQVDVDVPGGLTVARSLPIAVYLTGLPDFEDIAGARQGATFARRFQTTVLSGLENDDIAAALQPFVLDGWEVPDGHGGMSLVHMTPDAAAEIADLCKGEPFLFQLAGERAWYAGHGTTITRTEVLAGWRTARSEATAHVERVLGRLPEKERSFLHAMAHLEANERTLKHIAQAMGLGSGSEAGTTSQRLDTVRGIIERGTIYTFRHRAVEAYLTTAWPDAP